jgi:hypothetical protein
MDNTIDLLQIKIEKAKSDLPENTLNAINAVDWRGVILAIKEKRRYSIEQLGDLELETELLLCGLSDPKDYPRELESRMKISKMEASELVNEMNNLVFSKIKDGLIKNTERKEVFAKNEMNDNQVLNNAGIEIIKPELLSGIDKEKITESKEEVLKKIEKPEQAHPILAQKLSGFTKSEVVETQHSLDNITKPAHNASGIADAGGTNTPTIDPYREKPE